MWHLNKIITHSSSHFNLLVLSAFVLGISHIIGGNNISSPLADRHAVLEESLDLGIGTAGGFTDTEPRVSQQHESGSAVDETDLGTQVAVVVHVGTGEDHEPDSEEEDGHGARGDLVPVAADGDF